MIFLRHSHDLVFIISMPRKTAFVLRWGPDSPHKCSVIWRAFTFHGFIMPLRNFSLNNTVKFIIQVAPHIPNFKCLLTRLAVVFCPIHWNQVSSWEWRCSWSSANRRCSNYIWMINNYIAYYSASCIRGFTVLLMYFLHCYSHIKSAQGGVSKNFTRQWT